MFEEGNIVIIANKTYRVGQHTRGKCIKYKPILARFYHHVENIFPFNDIEGEPPILLYDDEVDNKVLFIFPNQLDSVFIDIIKNQIKTSKDFSVRLQKGWVKIGKYEYKITFAYGSERCNLIYREPGKISATYNILHADDYDAFI
jgi:hypothetical protein